MPKKADETREQASEREAIAAIGPEIGEKPLAWHDPREAPFRLAGFPWLAEEGVYRRLPRRPDHPIPPAVDELANHTAGGQIVFRTDSSALTVQVRLSGPANMNHMPATGQCGFDCYLGPPGRQVYCNTAKYDHTQTSYSFAMFEGLAREMRDVTLIFPLYQGVEEVRIGLDRDAAVHAPPPYVFDRKIVIYGTSITQGGCATRPGMAYPNILSRRIDAEFVNLGFSGSGKGEAEVARLVAAVPDPGLLVLDYEANCVSPERFRETLPAFIRIYREDHPDVPILVVSQIRFARETYDRELRELRLLRKSIQIGTVNACRDRGDERISFFDGGELLGMDYHECTVDGIHPTDLGFARMAEGLAPAIRQHIRGCPESHP
ncbi:SGNH/GDSL hydrolase family protein [Cohnella sp. REN36]|uniref:SGNH/GDSL hydrolase family protein n=1 Tax=Cohnella sp. REN36 TaxID=2887347 RepID=UPI001D13DBC0|nr:SGNH/GDSL hydrolase family protein [Cohnella sp. REN36]MCC3377389.1 SGNH/GDSL hydrolase family protein [Cohnella sp. REN36]